MNEAQETHGSTLISLENLRTRLLDLTARNRLLNFGHAKTSSLRVIDELPDRLRNSLLADSELRFLPVAEPPREELIQAGYIEINRGRVFTR